VDVAKQYPEKLEALKKAWDEEARINLALPLDDRTATEILGIERPSGEPKRDRYVYYPGTAPVPEGVAVNVRNRSYKILANVEITDANASGVIFAHGSRFGGHTLFIKDRKLHYVYNFLGIKPEQEFVSTVELKPGKYTLGMEFTRNKAGAHNESIGTTKLYVNDQVVAEGPMKTQPGKFTLSGDGLCVGFDSGDAVSQHYQAPGKFEGGTIQGVGVTVEKASYADLEQEAQRALMRD
jgi:arylsulfatase